MSKQRTHAPPRTGLILLACCIGQLLVVLDGTIVNVALPSIQGALHFDANSLQWVINAFMIPMAGLLLLAGRMADLFSRRGFFLAGVALFTVASLVGGFAVNAGMLIAARAAQGVGIALIAPATLTVLGTTFTEPKARAKAFGLWGAASGSGGAIGVIAGGVITDLVSWRWVLLINVPVGIALFAVAAVSITPSPTSSSGPSRLDVPGAVSVTIGIAALVFGITQSERAGWTSPQTLIAFAVAAVMLAFFLYDQAKLAKQPMMPLDIFRNRSVAAANVAMFCVGAALVATFYFLTMLMQMVLGYSPLRTGFAYLPLSLSSLVGATVLATALGRFGARFTLITGLLVAAVGLGWLSLADEGASYPVDLLGPSLVFGIGLGIVVATAANVGTAGVSKDQQGLASGLLTTAQTLGGAAGLAVLVAIANSRTGAVLAGAGEDMRRAALVAGYSRAFLMAAVLLVLAAVAAATAPKPVRDKATQRERVRA